MKPYVIRISSSYDIETIMERDPADHPAGPQPPQVAHVDHTCGPYWIVELWASDPDEAAREALRAVRG